VTDPAEDAYTEGFKLWEAGNYDQAITSLRAFTSAYPKHRRVSYANNLVGRALLDTGQARAAAEALLANYRSNPRGERAADSLYYLGQALMQLGQPGQACKVYSELDAVYGAKVRADLKTLVQAAQTKAQCS
jgi:TolA-binding protein